MVDHDALVDLARHETLEASDEVALGETFSGPSSDIVNGRLVKTHAHNHGALKRCIRFAAAGSRKPVTIRESRCGGDRAGAAELGECGFGADAFRVVAEHNQHLGGGVGADSEPVSQGRCVGVGEII